MQMVGIIVNIWQRYYFNLETKGITLVVQDIEESIGKLVEEADRIIIKDFF